MSAADRLRAFKYRWLDPWLFRFAPPPRRASKRQEERIELPAPTNADVLCFPIIEWDLRFQRPQQLMVQFGRAGHRVFYIDPVFRQDGPPYVLTRKAPNVFEVSLRGPRWNVYRQLVPRTDAFDRFLRETEIRDAMAIVQFPSWQPLVETLAARPLIYDCMDSIRGFATVSRRIAALEEPLLRNADFVIASSLLLEQEARRHASRVLLLRNACDYDAFATVPASKNARPVIGYFGAISYWFDVELVTELAALRRDWDFVLIGDPWGADVARLSKLPNVTLTGEQPYATIPQSLATFDVGIIPFKRMPLTEATNPVKAYEMLAGGKPIVAVPIPEMVALQPFARLASTAGEFAREIEAAMRENDDDAIAKRRAFAREQTWTKRFEELTAALRVMQ
jgi:glycosyltransferase involved in cell wall biosynthesis